MEKLKEDKYFDLIFKFILGIVGVICLWGTSIFFNHQLMTLSILLKSVTIDITNNPEYALVLTIFSLLVTVKIFEFIANIVFGIFKLIKEKRTHRKKINDFKALLLLYRCSNDKEVIKQIEKEIIKSVEKWKD